jgi:hypothetical protein
MNVVFISAVMRSPFQHFDDASQDLFKWWVVGGWWLWGVCKRTPKLQAKGKQLAWNAERNKNLDVLK